MQAAAVLSPMLTALAAPAEIDAPSLYEQSCAMCHFDGRESEAAPALVGSKMVANDRAALIRVILHGSRDQSKPGAIMPPTQGLTDEEIAAITTYVRQRYGTAKDVVTAAEVAEQRKTPLSR